ncbi:hypothetical protein EB118_06365 [bacterium]|nr:hypothetical protein [bacterium]NDC94381.1 hypothetical protein [bacterium]NDD83916.1 hypothetical protein [bacterium]NDG29702.1 hypothetical protein [bacterium]
MSRYKLTRLHPTEFDLTNLHFRKITNAYNPDERYGYDQKLNDFRNQIDNITSDNWKKVRWYINEYDFLVKDPIINRAFYKYWEIINEFDIFEDYVVKDDIILHVAEAPGGFIQGTNIYLQIDSIQRVEPQPVVMDKDGFKTVQSKRKNKRDYIVYSISLNKDLPQYKMYNLPTYNKNVVNKHVCVTYGKDHTGDINNFENVMHLQKLARRNFYLITADGGFDEGIDFNNKEQLHYNLILSEIKTAIALQKEHGHFVLKVFDIFTETSLHLLYLLYLSYKEMYIYKPKTSRPTNSEKYVVCKFFQLSEDTRDYIVSMLQPTKGKAFTVFRNIPESFVESIRYINTNMVQKQCAFLKRAIDLCNDESFLQNYETQVESLVDLRKETFHQWEEAYNLGTYI